MYKFKKRHKTNYKMLTINLFNNLPDYSFDTFNREKQQKHRYEYEAALEEELRRRHRARVMKEQTCRRELDERKQRDIFAAQMHQRELENRRQRQIYEDEMERRRQLHLQAEAMERERHHQRLELLERQEVRKMMRKKIEYVNRIKRMAAQYRKKSIPAYQIIQGLNGQFFTIEDPRHLFGNSSRVGANEDDRVKLQACVDSNTEPSACSPYPSKSADPAVKNASLNLGEKKSWNSAMSTKEVVMEPILKEHTGLVEVEDASDSECEDEFSDYFHNRTPRGGEWIEPVDGIEHMKF